MRSQTPNLRPLLFNAVRVELSNNIVLEGRLIGYDAFCNLTLDSAVSGEATIEGVVVVRGQTIEQICAK